MADQVSSSSNDVLQPNRNGD